MTTDPTDIPPGGDAAAGFDAPMGVPFPSESAAAEPGRTLGRRYEAFCAAYARRPHGPDAARAAGYSADNAAKQAHRLLSRPEIRARISVISCGHDPRLLAARDLIAKLAPVYDAALAGGDLDTVLQTVELQARILGLVHGGATIRPRGVRGGDDGDGVLTGRQEDGLDALA